VVYVRAVSSPPTDFAAYAHLDGPIAPPTSFATFLFLYATFPAWALNLLALRLLRPRSR